MAADARAEFDPKEIARAAFPTAFRGYDQDAVRRYLSRLATAISRAQQLGLLGSVDTNPGDQSAREAELELEASELRARVDELEDLLASTPVDATPVALAARDLDEAELIELLGHETARILEQARSAAADIVHRAEAEAEAVREQADLDVKAIGEEAEDMLSAARMEADETRAAAAAEAKRSQSRSKAEAKRSREQAKTQVEDMLAEATLKAEDELNDARGRSDDLLAEAEHLREEVLGDLVRRRRLYREQLARMNKARDRLSQSLNLARTEIDAISGDLDESAGVVLELDGIEGGDDNPDAPADEGGEIGELIAQLNAGTATRSDGSALAPVSGARPVSVDLRDGIDGLEGGDDLAIDDELVMDVDAEIDLDDESDDDLKVEYLTVDDLPPGDGDGGDEGLMALKYAASTSNGRAALPAANGTGTAVATAIDPVDVANGELTLDLAGLSIMGAGPGTMHRAATRGDLPRSTPFAGTLPAAFEGRDAALARALPGFRRRLKRAVNDDQSQVLDRLRAGRGLIRADELPVADEQLDRYLEALRPALHDVVKAGGELLGATTVPEAGVDNLCTQLARHVVECLRTPTVEAIEAATEPDREAILDPVRATYRDFRNGVLPDLIEDALHEAFALGLFSAVDETEDIVWLTDPRLDPDPICEENSASASLPKGTLFPSGHARPLSMPGCRCLAIPAR